MGDLGPWMIIGVGTVCDMILLYLECSLGVFECQGYWSDGGNDCCGVYFGEWWLLIGLRYVNLYFL